MMMMMGLIDSSSTLAHQHNGLTEEAVLCY